MRRRSETIQEEGADFVVSELAGGGGGGGTKPGYRSGGRVADEEGVRLENPPKN